MLTDRAQWFVFYTLPKREKLVDNFLVKNRYETFLPLTIVVKKWSDRKKRLLLPLFPNYIFVKTEQIRVWQVCRTPGIVKCISFEGNPYAIAEKEISLIKYITNGNFNVQEYREQINVGCHVRIVSGPLMGIDGILIERKSESLFVIRLAKINRSVSINIAHNLIQIVDPKMTSYA